MGYTIIYSRKAKEDIDKLDIVAKKALKKKLELYIKNPLPYAVKLKDSNLGDYRWRVGNYRIVFDMEDTIINVLRVGHRKEIYKFK